MHVLCLTRPCPAGRKSILLSPAFFPLSMPRLVCCGTPNGLLTGFLPTKILVGVQFFVCVYPASTTLSSAAALEMLTVFSSRTKKTARRNTSAVWILREGNEFLPPGTGIRNERRRVFRGNVSGFLGATKLHSHTHLSLNSSPPPLCRCKKCCII